MRIVNNITNIMLNGVMHFGTHWRRSYPMDWQHSVTYVMITII